MSETEQNIELAIEQQRLKCGLIMPISKSQGLDPEHWLNVKGIICEALEDTALDIRLVSESDDVGVIHKSIVQNIYQDDIVICDVSTHNPNVMFELGLRLAFDKATVIIKDDETPFSFDTQVIQHIVYKRNLHYPDIVSFKKELKNKVLATLEQSKKDEFSTFLKHFTIDHVSKISERDVGKEDLILEQLSVINRKLNSAPVNFRKKGLFHQDIEKNSNITDQKFLMDEIDRVVIESIDDYLLSSGASKKEFRDLILNEKENYLLNRILLVCSERLFKDHEFTISQPYLKNKVLKYVRDGF